MSLNKFTRTPGPGQLAIDFDQERADLLPTLINFLRAEPDFTEVAQELTMRFLREFSARWVHFGLLGEDASIRPLGAFGLSIKGHECLDDASIWSPLPMAEAVRSKESMLVLSDSRMAHEIPSELWFEASPPSIVSVPLTTSTKTVGVMTVGFDPVAAIGSQHVQFMEAITDLLVLYVTSWVSAQGERKRSTLERKSEPNSLHNRVERPRKSEVTITELTRRHKSILGYLADGLTYDQIGSRIGFSHSTVRMDLMQIYRFFGVTSRDAAVAAALERGLLDHRSIDEDVYTRLGASKSRADSSIGRASRGHQFDD